MNFAAVLGGCLIAALSLGGYAVQEQNAVETVRIGIYQNQPKVFLDQAGDPAGFWVDLLEHIADAEDWSLEYVPCQWYRCLQAVEEGQLDLMVDVAYSEERDRSFDFNQEVVLASWSVVYARSGLRLDSMLDLDQKRVAVLKGSIQYAALVERTQAFGVRPKFVEVADFGEMFRLINNGDVDAGVVNRFFGMEAASRYKVVKTNILVGPSRLHFIAPQGKQGELLATLDLHLKDLAADSNSAYYQALERWLEPEGRFGWVQVKHILIDLAVYAPIVSLAAVIVWNRFLSREVHRRKQAEALLRESEQRYSTLVAAVPVGIFRADAGGNCTYVNDPWCQITGLSPEAAMGEGWAKGLHPDDRDLVATEWYQSAQENRSFQLEYRFQRPDGKVTWVYGQSVAERDADGQVVGYVGTITDISERKQAEAALRESEQRFRLAIANAPFPIMLHAEDGEVLQINATWTELTGYTQQDIPTTKAWAQRAYGDRATTVLENVIAKKYALESRWDEGEFTVTTSDSQQRIWNFSSAPLGLLPDGRRVVISMAADVTQRRQSEAALRESEQRFRNMAANVPGAIFQYVLHPDGSDGVIYMSRGCYGLWEVEAEAVVEDAQVLWKMVHPDDRPALYKSVITSARTLQPWFWQWRIITPSGQMKWLEAAGRPEHHENGDVVWDTLIMDVSDRKQAEAALRESEVRYRKVVEAQTDFILRSLPDTTITFANKALCQALGTSLEDIVGKKRSDFANPDDWQESVFRRLAELSPTNPRFVVETRDNRADGQVGWTQWLNEGIFDQSGQLVEIQSVGRDITKLKQVEQALRESEERLRLVTENMSDLVCLHHPNGHYLYVTPSSQALLGYCPEELIGRDPYELFHPDERDRIRQEAYEPAWNDIPSPITYRIRKKTGEYIWLETLTQPILAEDGQVKHWQTTSRDVSDRVKVEQQLKHDALHDGLTGLPNRSLLMERLDLALKRAKRHPEFQCAVLFLDLDNFKVVNDSLGHIIGDEMLLEVATHLIKFIRETDLAARLGGDEFVILLEEIDGIEEAVRIAERILAALRSPLSVADREVFTSTSIGIVAGTTSHHCAEDLLRDADLAMYRAKHSGRGQYAIFDPAMHLQVVQRLHLENDLRQALENSEFVLYYQPIVNLKTQLIQGFEVLIRWQHPQRGFVSPGEFIEIAEETGLIVPIGQWILHTACQQLAAWQAQFPAKPLRISVNLSVKQLQSLLLQQLEEVLTTYSLQHNSLVLEITESMLVQNVEATCNLLNQVKAKGICLSIDDFGTGYSSLSYLHQLPVDALKIDRTFVSLAGPDARNQVIAESIIALSNLLGLNAIAEGVETPQQLQWLKGLGCELAQGFLFSPPVPATQATELLKRTLPSLPYRGS